MKGNIDMIDERTLEKIAGCWVKYRKVLHVGDLEECCRHVICTFLLKIAEDDSTFIDDMELGEDVSYCRKFERKVLIPGVL